MLRRTAEVVGRSRRTEAEIVAHIAEIDERRLFVRCACSSMFSYCVEVLHFSEAEAYLRIAAARASREHPMLLDMLADGRLHLSRLARLAPHLTLANRDAVLARSCRKSKREVEELLAELHPRADAPAWIRRLPAPRASRNAARPLPPPMTETAQADLAPGLLVPEGVAPTLLIPHGLAPGPLVPDGVAPTRAPDAVDPAQLVPERVPACAAAPSSACAPGGSHAIEATSPGRYKVQFTASRELRDKLERLKELMGAIDLAEVIGQAVSEKVARLEARRFALCQKPCSTPSTTPRHLVEGSTVGRIPAREGARSSRHIPAEVRRAVSLRDGAQCAYTDGRGHRCTSRRHLEFHHRRPYGHGGRHTVENTCLLCSTHHALMTEVDFAPRAKARDEPRSISTEAT